MTSAEERARRLLPRVVRVPHKARDHGEFRERLALALEGLIPFAVVELSEVSDEERERLRRHAVETINSRADVLQFQSKGPGGSLAGLARAFVMLAEAEGGITALGVHMCAQDHEECPLDSSAE